MRKYLNIKLADSPYETNELYGEDIERAGRLLIAKGVNTTCRAELNLAFIYQTAVDTLSITISLMRPQALLRK
jgi:hypothetical protein